MEVFVRRLENALFVLWRAAGT